MAYCSLGLPSDSTKVVGPGWFCGCSHVSQGTALRLYGAARCGCLGCSGLRGQRKPLRFWHVHLPALARGVMCLFGGSGSEIVTSAVFYVLLLISLCAWLVLAHNEEIFETTGVKYVDYSRDLPMDLPTVMENVLARASAI